jgi:hypothetical protein
MPKLVVNSAICQCTMGLAPSSLIVLPMRRVTGVTQPAANIMDNKPLVNVMPFGMCTSIANPTVAAATSAAMGVLTPMPCIPNTPGPWVPGAIKTMIDGQPALHDGCKLMCTWAGVISINFAGQVTVNVS